jgi:hypothetical protein
MIIESTILISAIALIPMEKTLSLDYIKKTPYELLYKMENTPNKNTIEYNTITIEELIMTNNKNLLLHFQ